jgi:diadenylate cyclase
VSEERGSISFCFNGNIVTNLDGASLRQALLGLFGQRARKRPVKAAGKRPPGTVTQTGTGSFRVSIPPPPSGNVEGREGSVQMGRPHFSSASEPPPPQGSRSHFSASGEPVPVRESTPPKSEKGPPLITRPMAAAKPIETPPASQGPEPPSGPREE